jgi:hypothetical protein
MAEICYEDLERWQKASINFTEALLQLDHGDYFSEMVARVRF